MRIKQILSHISKFALLLLAFAFTALPAMADTISFNGDTTGGPTFNRPNEGQPPISLSPFATAVRLRRAPFTVSAAGVYTFTLVSTGFATNGYDPFLALYVNNGNLDPALSLQLANALAASGNGGSNTALININLLPGANYLSVQTGFANDDFGPYTLTATGPGTITFNFPTAPVPEPATMILLGTGLTGVIGAARRRRRARG